MKSFFNSQKYKDRLLRIEKAFNYDNKSFSDVPLCLQPYPYWMDGNDENYIPEDTSMASLKEVEKIIGSGSAGIDR